MEGYIANVRTKLQKGTLRTHGYGVKEFIWVDYISGCSYSVDHEKYTINRMNHSQKTMIDVQ